MDCRVKPGNDDAQRQGKPVAPSLRAQRSNPEAKKKELDCFVASLLAMTLFPILTPAASSD
jgi:hypothetical protein